MKPPKTRKLELSWNIGGLLLPATPQEIYTHISQQPSLLSRVPDLMSLIHESVSAFYGGRTIWDPFMFAEFKYDELDIRISYGAEQTHFDIYCEIYCENTLVLIYRCHPEMVGYCSPSAVESSLQFLTYIILYASSLLADKLLLDYLTDTTSNQDKRSDK